MHPVFAVGLDVLSVYVALGAVTALAFVCFGVTQVQPAAVSLGARVLLLPGALVLWPYVLWRWIRS